MRRPPDDEDQGYHGDDLDRTDQSVDDEMADDEEDEQFETYDGEQVDDLEYQRRLIEYEQQLPELTRFFINIIRKAYGLVYRIGAYMGRTFNKAHAFSVVLILIVVFWMLSGRYFSTSTNRELPAWYLLATLCSFSCVHFKGASERKEPPLLSWWTIQFLVTMLPVAGIRYHYFYHTQLQRDWNSAHGFKTDSDSYEYYAVLCLNELVLFCQAAKVLIKCGFIRHPFLVNAYLSNEELTYYEAYQKAKAARPEPTQKTKKQKAEQMEERLGRLERERRQLARQLQNLLQEVRARTKLAQARVRL